MKLLAENSERLSKGDDHPACQFWRCKRSKLMNCFGIRSEKNHNGECTPFGLFARWNQRLQSIENEQRVFGMLQCICPVVNMSKRCTFVHAWPSMSVTKRLARNSIESLFIQQWIIKTIRVWTISSIANRNSKVSTKHQHYSVASQSWVRSDILMHYSFHCRSLQLDVHSAGAEERHPPGRCLQSTWKQEVIGLIRYLHWNCLGRSTGLELSLFRLERLPLRLSSHCVWFDVLTCYFPWTPKFEWHERKSISIRRTWRWSSVGSSLISVHH